MCPGRAFVYSIVIVEINPSLRQDSDNPAHWQCVGLYVKGERAFVSVVIIESPLNLKLTR